MASVGSHKVLAFRTAKKHQDRLGELLEKNKLSQGLSKTEVSEMEQLMLLEHIISLAKARALEKLGKSPAKGCFLNALKSKATKNRTSPFLLKKIRKRLQLPFHH